MRKILRRLSSSFFLRTYLYVLAAIALIALLTSCTDTVRMPEGKEVYVPGDMSDQDLQDPESEWSYHRMAYTDDIVLLWQKGFGQDPNQAPPLDELPMTVDLQKVMDCLQRDYVFFRDSLDFLLPGSVAHRVRMLTSLVYTTDGVACGGVVDDTLGALWVAPCRLQDEHINVLAHELGHSFQCQIGVDRPDGPWQAYGFYEMASQWMLWQVNPDWIGEETYHYDAFLQAMHKAFLSPENIYRSPYVLQYWSQLRGRDIIARLFKQGRDGEDAVMAYKRLCSLSQSQFNDEIFDACRHFVGLDYTHAFSATRPYADRAATPSEYAGGGWQQPQSAFRPENYGFNVFPVDSTLLRRGSLTLRFEGLSSDAKAGYRYGFVARQADGRYSYSPTGSQSSGALSWTLPPAVSKAWVVVMGAPQVHWRSDLEETRSAVWPYRFKIG